ncbi:anti sigma factor C-terminal domain-containing protein [Viridibacillus sp. FSL R5-0477]|uniref:Anti-sigma-M factor yhdL n=1 Tax=Viridibacillus arenosi FSL R5-213 TaxID=1227360 RepID=W4F075_9BACL|nr:MULTISPECIES: anti-sigma factor [Viridibacillus]ETT86185.1 anti-sigma-M factor yhdL [Viridibacillus arenosi FSL R5-213]OMC84909.1 anti-sigma factor [Viridibacillus sp. FSL H8-0123]OMC91958.1 anti-sigma factor [Viridibacillus arenosi]
MDSYEQLLQQAKDSEKINTPSTNVVKKAIASSKRKLILTTLTIALLIVPTCYMLTFLYYAFGTKSTTLMDVTSQTLYVTDPNTTLEELEFDMDFSLFSMLLSFEQYKQIGDEVYPIKHYDTRFMLNDLVEKTTTSKLEKTYPKYPTITNQWLVHPENQAEFNTSEEWQVLKGLPDETVVEAYISLNNLFTVEEVIQEMPKVDVTWAAIYTGVEDKMLSANGNVVSPIGYPVQQDYTNWSPFKNSTSHEQTFLSILHFLANYEDIATAVSSHKNLELKERISYLEKQDMKTYAVVITGPKAEIEQLKDNTMIKHLKLGEVKLWNWVR